MFHSFHGLPAMKIWLTSSRLLARLSVLKSNMNLMVAPRVPVWWSLILLRMPRRPFVSQFLQSHYGEVKIIIVVHVMLTSFSQVHRLPVWRTSSRSYLRQVYERWKRRCDGRYRAERRPHSRPNHVDALISSISASVCRNF